MALQIYDYLIDNEQLDRTFSILLDPAGAEPASTVLVKVTYDDANGLTAAVVR